MIDSKQYQELIAQESKHWGEFQPDPRNPQIWHDPQLFEIFFGREYRQLIEQAEANGPAILEVGCGEGALAIELAQRGLQVTAIDLSPERIERARAKAHQLNVSSRPVFLVADLNTTQLPSATYDCVVAHDSLHHVLHINHLCSEVFKTLKPNGRFLIMDFMGMGRVRKIMAAALYAVLPTYLTYREKWSLRHRLRGFLASESQKRRSLEQGTASSLRQDSPFEEIAQRSIVQEIAKRFVIARYATFCPFWYYFAPKIRLPKSVKYAVARSLRRMDDLMLILRLTQGAYFSLEARKP